MFTGIVEEIGKISIIKAVAGGKRIRISASGILCDISVNDSICVNGVCLTVINIEDNGFWVDAVGATLEKSTFNKIQLSSYVNLERALKFSDRLGGHIVQGHINGTGIITGIRKLGDNYQITVNVPGELEKYLVDEGSIAIDGISLTIAGLNGSDVGISVIPHTWNNTTIRFKHVGSMVNIEIDILAKYIDKLISNKKSTLIHKLNHFVYYNDQ